MPAGETARIYAVFSAESAVRRAVPPPPHTAASAITVDGNELNPAVGTDFAFDSTDDADEGVSSSCESHAIARSSETLAAGNHPVQVQIRASPPDADLAARRPGARRPPCTKLS